MKNNINDNFNYKNIFSMHNKKVVIFGGTGKLGINFSKTLSAAGAKVYLLDKVKKKQMIKISFFINVMLIQKQMSKIYLKK